MPFLKERSFGAKDLEVGALQCAIAKTSEVMSCSGTDVELSEILPDGTSVRRRLPKLEDLATVCNLTDRVIYINFWHTDRQLSLLRISEKPTGFWRLNASAPDSQFLAQIFSAFEGALGLVPASPPDDNGNTADQIDALETRIGEIETVLLGPESKVRCFLSFKFVPEDEAVALQVQQFLSLLNVEVLSGVGYEPRRISEKVLSKLNEKLDCVVVLVTHNGESMWTRDEIAACVGRGIAVIPVVESGAHFTPGLFGDLEFIPFSPGHIGDAFLKLVQAINFVRSMRSGKRLQAKVGAKNGEAGPAFGFPPTESPR